MAGWTKKNLTYEKIESGENLHPHLWVKFKTRTHIHWVSECLSGVHQVYKQEVFYDQIEK
jgi:hypothetical protein